MAEPRRSSTAEPISARPTYIGAFGRIVPPRAEDTAEAPPTTHLWEVVGLVLGLGRVADRLRDLRSLAALEHLARVDRVGLRGLAGYYRIEVVAEAGGPGGLQRRVWYFRYGKAIDFLLLLSRCHEFGWEDLWTSFEGLHRRQKALATAQTCP